MLENFLEKFLENFKRFPLAAQFIFCLQLIINIIGLYDLLNLMHLVDIFSPPFRELSYIYPSIGQSVPSKFTIFVAIIATLLVMAATLFLISKPNKQSVLIYLGVLVFNLILGIIVTGFNLPVITGLIVLGFMVYIINQNRDFFGI